MARRASKKATSRSARTRSVGRGAKSTLASLKPKGVSPLALGLVGAGVVGAGLLLAKKASAAQAQGAGAPGGSVLSPTGTPGSPAVPVNPSPAPAGSPSTNLTPGGLAQVTGAPHGVRLRAAPGNDLSGAVLTLLPQGSMVSVLDVSRPDGWVKVQASAGTGSPTLSSTAIGWVCNTCGLDGLTAGSPAMSMAQQLSATAPGGNTGPEESPSTQPADAGVVADNSNPFANFLFPS